MTRRSFRLVRIAISAALYVALSLAIAPLTFGQMQVRFSEMMILLCFFNKDYCLAMILGCAITNAFSPLGIIDVLFGTLGTAISVLFIRLAKKIWLAWIPPVICTVFVALEFYITASEPFWLSFATIGAGELIAVGIIGVPVFMLLMKNNKFLEMIGADEYYYNKISKKNTSSLHDDKDAHIDADVQDDTDDSHLDVSTPTEDFDTGNAKDTNNNDNLIYSDKTHNNALTDIDTTIDDEIANTDLTNMEETASHCAIDESNNNNLNL